MLLPDLLRPSSTPDLREAAFELYVDELARARLRTAATLVAVLMVAGGLVAELTREAHARPGFVVRLAVLALALGLRVAAGARVAAGRGRALAVLLTLAVGVDLEVQILETGGASSPYFAGLAVLVLASSLLFPFTGRLAAGLSIAALGLYALPLLALGLAPPGALALPCFFLFAAGLVATSAAHEASALRRREWLADAELRAEQERSERLLWNILPRPIADRLKLDHASLADGFAEVTILFADIVGFTRIASLLAPEEVVALLNRVFSRFDDLADELGLEKIKTIGDAYMVVGGLPELRADHAEAIADMALAMQDVVARFELPDGSPLRMRMGMHTGPVVAGVIGHRKFIYDLWGDAVNVASRMESQGEPGAIQVTEATYERLRERYELEPRGLVHVKGKGEMSTWFLRAKRDDAAPPRG